jgi:hypothetical protein
MRQPRFTCPLGPASWDTRGTQPRQLTGTRRTDRGFRPPTERRHGSRFTTLIRARPHLPIRLARKGFETGRLIGSAPASSKCTGLVHFQKKTVRSPGGNARRIIRRLKSWVRLGFGQLFHARPGSDTLTLGQQERPGEPPAHVIGAGSVSLSLCAEIASDSDWL